MAIDDNKTYGLTGAQVKDLAGRIKDGGTRKFAYTDYNPGGTTTPTNLLGDFFVANDVKGGDTVVFEFDISAIHSPQYKINSGETIEDSASIISEPYTRAHEFIVLNQKFNDATSGFYILMTNIGMGPSDTLLLYATYGNSSGYSPKVKLDVPAVENFGFNTWDESTAMSVKSSQVIQDLISSATNIQNVGPVEVDLTQYPFTRYNDYDILEQTIDEWDFEWMGTFRSITGFDYESAATNTIIPIWVKDKNGLPLYHSYNADDMGPGFYRIVLDGGTEITLTQTSFDGSQVSLIQKRADGSWGLYARETAHLLQRQSAGGGGIGELTTEDYDYPDDNPTGVALWRLDGGLYKTSGSVNCFVHTTTTTTPSSGETILILKAPASDPNYVRTFILFQNANSSNLPEPYLVSNSGADVLNGNKWATLSNIYADPSTRRKISLGGAQINGSDGIAIGINSVCNGNYAVAIGPNANANHIGSVALGSHTMSSGVGTVNIGPGQSSYGYNNSNYRLLTGLYDPQNAHDAATKGYVDSAIGGIVGFDYQVVSELPTSGEKGIIYLVPADESGVPQNVYYEYIWIAGSGGSAGSFELIGSTQTDLSDYVTTQDLATELADYTPTTSLATVATSGSYTDLSNTPTIPAAQIQSDWNQTNSTAKDYIKNKPDVLGHIGDGKVYDNNHSPYSYFVGNDSAGDNFYSSIYSKNDGSINFDWHHYDIADGYDSYHTYRLAKYSDLPTVNDSTITLTSNGTTIDTFTTNASSNKSIALPIPATFTTNEWNALWA